MWHSSCADKRMKMSPFLIDEEGHFLCFLNECMKNCSKITKNVRNFGISACIWGLDFYVYNRIYLCVGQNMTLVRRETLKRYTPHRCAEKEQGFTHERYLAVYLFFSWIPVRGLVKKADAVLWRKEPSTRKVCIFHGIIIHYLLKKQGDYYHE